MLLYSDQNDRCYVVKHSSRFYHCIVYVYAQISSTTWDFLPARARPMRARLNVDVIVVQVCPEGHYYKIDLEHNLGLCNSVTKHVPPAKG